MNGKMSWMKLVSSCLAAWLLLSACRPLLTPTPAARTGVTPSAVRTQEPSPAQPSPTTADALPTPRATRSEEPLDPPPAPAARAHAASGTLAHTHAHGQSVDHLRT